jgi:hypothetical protein
VFCVHNRPHPMNRALLSSLASTHTHTLSLSPRQDSAQNEEEEEEKEEDYNVQCSIASTLDAFTSSLNPNFI